ncbi:hypothetical protein [Curtobacterium sp. MCBD17_040]|uniref:hypothetical protein n=1 Tax=Curtobacterium sp. MCBD17_040 TaxID=2175674 RepID=UPI000DAA636E|nr:hypothetical protein [Curtobacterium sp. MCBD17_040]WIB65519.1 hypothetical protein DEI94_19285 [Curtobacterium sp. MCBD17_040]
MKKKTLAGLAIGAAAVMALTAGAIGSANASVIPANATDAQLLAPSIHSQGSGFYSQAQVPSVWAAVTGHFPAALPTGYQFPTATPAEMQANGKGPRVYQEGLPDVLAAQYWRCAWLDYSLQPNLTAIQADNANTHLKMSTYMALPSVSGHVPESDLEAAIASTASEDNVSAHQAEFTMMCSTLNIEKSN